MSFEPEHLCTGVSKVNNQTQKDSGLWKLTFLNMRGCLADDEYSLRPHACCYCVTGWGASLIRAVITELRVGWFTEHHRHHHCNHC
jgi:ribosomal protein L32